MNNSKCIKDLDIFGCLPAWREGWEYASLGEGDRIVEDCEAELIGKRDVDPSSPKGCVEAPADKSKSDKRSTDVLCPWGLLISCSAWNWFPGIIEKSESIESPSILVFFGNGAAHAPPRLIRSTSSSVVCRRMNEYANYFMIIKLILVQI